MKGAVARRFCVATALAVFAGLAHPARAEPQAGPSALPLELASDTECPAPEAIGRALREMIGLSAEEHLNEVARLTHARAALVVTLHDADGRLLGERALPLDGTCDELARATAVVLATWLSDAHPEFVPRLAQRANAASTEPNGATTEPNGASTEPNTANTEPNTANTAKPPPPLPPYADVRSSGTVRIEHEWRLRTAAAVGASVLPAPAAFAGTLSVAFVPVHRGVGASLRASALTSRERDVPGGKVRYLHWPLEAGATLRLATPSVAFELDGGGALGWLHVAGRSLSPNRSAGDATFGPFGAVRLLTARGLVQPFVEVAGVFWLGSSRVYADPTRPSVALPPGEVTLSLGAAFVP